MFKEKSTSNQDIYTVLENMFENMDKLFSSLDVDEENFNLLTPNLFLQFVEHIINKGTVLKNIKLLNKKLEKAASISKDSRLENWNNSLCIVELNKKIEVLNSNVNTLKQEVLEISKEKKRIALESIELETKLKNIKEEFIEEKKLLKNQNIDTIKSIITFRDSVIMRQGLAESQEESSLKSLLNSLIKETANLLEQNHVEILDGKGSFDNSIHIVVEVKQTDDKDLHDKVAQVFRPGYIFEEEMIRPQEVILYSYSED